MVGEHPNLAAGSPPLLFIEVEAEDEFSLLGPPPDPIRAAFLMAREIVEQAPRRTKTTNSNGNGHSEEGMANGNGQQRPMIRRRRLSLVEALNNGSIEIDGPQCSNYFFVDDHHPPPLWAEMFPAGHSSQNIHLQRAQRHPPIGHQSPARLRPGKFPVHQEDVSAFPSTSASAGPSTSDSAFARQKRRSRSQPGPRARESGVSTSSSSAAVQELSDFIEEDCEMAQCQMEGNATIWTGKEAPMPASGAKKGQNSSEAGGRGAKGSCCSQDSGVRSSTHSAGSLTGSSDTDGDGHIRAPCCSTSSNPSGGVLFSAEAVFENVAMLRDELPFSPGDEVAVLDCPSADLWYGICGPRSGWFPAAYIRPKNRDLCRLCAADGQSAKLESGEHFPSAEMRLLRRRIVQELLSTEREYVRLLDDLVQGFLEQCRRRRELFPEERVQRIFGNLESIQSLHGRLLKEMQMAMDKKEPEKSALANVFLRNSHHFGIYTDYCNNRTLSCAELAQLESMPQYFHFFEACRLLRGMSKLSLDGFLLTPVQRICRYPLQLLELLKATPAGHPDRLALELAQRTMKQVAAQVNDGKRRVDAIQKIWLWQKSVHGFRGPDLVENNHRLLINGELNCRALWRGQPQWAKAAIQVYLFDQTIVLCRRDVLRRSQLIFKERMSLQGTSAQDLHDGKEPTTGASLKNSFKLAGPAREYIFACPDPATKGLWLEALRDRPRPQPPTPAERRLAMLMSN